MFHHLYIILFLVEYFLWITPSTGQRCAQGFLCDSYPLYWCCQNGTTCGSLNKCNQQSSDATQKYFIITTVCSMVSLIVWAVVHALRQHFTETRRSQRENYMRPPLVITTERPQFSSSLFQNMVVPTVPNPLLTSTSETLITDTNLICLEQELEQQISTANSNNECEC